MVLVSVTRLHLKSPRYFPGFLWHTALSSWQIVNIPGFLGGKLIGDKQGAAWTVTLWKDESAMRQYRNSGAHRQAMRYLPRWCDEAAVVHWQQEDTTLPEASEAYRRMVSEGHFTKVLQPSDNQQKRHIPEPPLPNRVPLHPRKKVRAPHLSAVPLLSMFMTKSNLMLRIFKILPLLDLNSAKQASDQHQNVEP